MTFTDEELQRLKGHIDKPGYESHTKRYKALLARLEESEHFVTKAVDAYPHLKDSDVYQRWRKSCGL